MDLSGLMSIPTVIMALVVAAAIGVAGFLALDGLDDSLTANSEGANSTAKIVTGLGNIFDFAPTWGTLVGVAVLILIIAGAFVAGAVGYNYGRNKGYF